MESFEIALGARRAIIVLYVGWSTYPRRAVATLKSAIPQLEPLEITFAVIDEESPDVRAWRNERAPESYSGDVPEGWGSLFWLEAGSVVDFEYNGGNLTLEELLVRTRHHWALDETTPPAR